MSEREFIEEFKRRANPEAEEWARQKTQEAIEQFDQEHTGKEINKLKSWQLRRLKEILERIEKRGGLN